MPRTFHIGELAVRTGRSVHTIRWYEAQGLIPGVVRDGAGRRLFDELHVGWLELIERLRQSGMAIADMRRYVSLVRQGKGTLKERQELLIEHRADVRRKIDDLRATLGVIDEKVEFYEEWLATGRRPELPEGLRRCSEEKGGSDD